MNWRKSEVHEVFLWIILPRKLECQHLHFSVLLHQLFKKGFWRQDALRSSLKKNAYFPVYRISRLAVRIICISSQLYDAVSPRVARTGNHGQHQVEHEEDLPGGRSRREGAAEGHHAALLGHEVQLGRRRLQAWRDRTARHLRHGQPGTFRWREKKNGRNVT